MEGCKYGKMEPIIRGHEEGWKGLTRWTTQETRWFGGQEAWAAPLKGC